MYGKDLYCAKYNFAIYIKMRIAKSQKKYSVTECNLKALNLIIANRA